jgi:hypothetical protein
MEKATLGAGNVLITLDGEEATLRPTLKAAQTLSRRADGLIGAIERVSRFDLDVITAVVALGLDRPEKDIAEAVWSTGASSLAPTAIKFLGILANGGRPADGSGGEGGADPRNG